MRLWSSRGASGGARSGRAVHADFSRTLQDHADFLRTAGGLLAALFEGVGATLHTGAMTDRFGRRGRRADLAEQLHHALVERGLTPLPGGARQLIDTKNSQVAAHMRMTEAVVLRQFGDAEIAQLAAVTADDWHAAKAVADAAGQIAVTVPSTDAAQLVMGLAMAVGQVIREVYGDLPAAAGEPR